MSWDRPQPEDIWEFARAKRQGIWHAQNRCMRFLNGAGDDIPGVTVDLYGDLIQTQLFDHSASPECEKMEKLLIQRLKPRFLVRKIRISPDGASLQSPKMEIIHNRDHQDHVASGWVVENSVRYFVDLLDTVNPGLFLDMRDNRQRLKDLALGKKVLNLFAYTCSFGVVAAVGGAALVHNVDISQKILDRGKKNLDGNGSDHSKVEFIRRDSREFLQSGVESDAKYDLIVLDPPSFSRSKMGVFSVSSEMQDLIKQCLMLLVEGGWLLVATNWSKLTPVRFAEWIEGAAGQANCTLSAVERGKPQKDFPRKGEMPESAMQYFWVQKA